MQKTVDAAWQLWWNEVATLFEHGVGREAEQSGKDAFQALKKEEAAQIKSAELQFALVAVAGGAFVPIATAPVHPPSSARGSTALRGSSTTLSSHAAPWIPSQSVVAGVDAHAQRMIPGTGIPPPSATEPPLSATRLRRRRRQRQWMRELKRGLPADNTVASASATTTLSSHAAPWIPSQDVYEAVVAGVDAHAQRMITGIPPATAPIFQLHQQLDHYMPAAPPLPADNTVASATTCAQEFAANFADFGITKCYFKHEEKWSILNQVLR